MKNNTNNTPLKELPLDFDRSVIKSRADGVGGNGGKVYFSRCDFMPMERNGFRGWFAFPDVRCNSSLKRSSRIYNVVNAGGWCEFVMLDKGHSACKPAAKVRIVEAFFDRGNVVVRIEKIGEEK